MIDVFICSDDSASGKITTIFHYSDDAVFFMNKLSDLLITANEVDIPVNIVLKDEYISVAISANEKLTRYILAQIGLKLDSAKEPATEHRVDPISLIEGYDQIDPQEDMIPRYSK